MPRVLYALLAASAAMQVLILSIQFGYIERPQMFERPIQARARDVSGVTAHLTASFSKGAPTASVVLMEFSDYECPFCARHATGVGPIIDEEFIASGRVRHAFVNLPLDIHPRATRLATAALCAGDQGKYWPMHAALFAEQPKTDAALFALTAELALASEPFRACLDDKGGVQRRRLKADAELAERLELSSTPSFAVGVAGDRGQVTIKRVIVGAQPVEVFRSALTEVLAATAPAVDGVAARQ